MKKKTKSKNPKGAKSAKSSAAIEAAAPNETHAEPTQNPTSLRFHPPRPRRPRHRKLELPKSQPKPPVSAPARRPPSATARSPRQKSSSSFVIMMLPIAGRKISGGSKVRRVRFDALQLDKGFEKERETGQGGREGEGSRAEQTWKDRRIRHRQYRGHSEPHARDPEPGRCLDVGV